MSFATSQPVVNRFLGGGDVATAIRTHLLANTGNQKVEKFAVVAAAVAGSAKMHPIRVRRVLHRGDVRLLALDLAS